MVVMQLHEVTDEDTKQAIDEAVENSAAFDEVRGAFATMTAPLEKEVHYHESDAGGEYKSYEAHTDDLTYTLSCRMNLDEPIAGVTCEITVRPNWANE